MITLGSRPFRQTSLISLAVLLMTTLVVLGGSLWPHPSKADSATSFSLAWGDNFDGQLGNGTTVGNSSTPLVVKLPDGVALTTITAGTYHNLAIGSDGKLYTWGDNYYGQLGNGSTTFSNTTPGVINLATGVTPAALAGGGIHSMAIGSNGKLYAWGADSNGQLGNGIITNNPYPLPVLVSLPAGVTAAAIAAGGYHSLAIGSDDKLYAWGYNAYGQLGNGNTSDSSTPIPVNLPAGVRATKITAGYFHNLAIGSNGKLYAWGDNTYGQLGDGNTSDTPTLVTVNLPAGVTATSLAAGASHSMAIGSDGKLYAWGYNNAGQLGNGNISNSYTPVPVNLPAGVRAIAIAAGGNHSMAIGSDGKLYAWGANDSGQLGNGTITTNPTPTPITVNLPTGFTPTAIAANYYNGIAVLPAPSLSIGSVARTDGNAGTTNFTFPVTLSYSPSQTVTVSYTTVDGTASAGSDYTATSGTLTFAPGVTSTTITVPVMGDTVSEPTETFFVTLSNLTNAMFAISQGTGLIIKDYLPPAGIVYAWGYNGDGELGNGTTTQSTTPTLVSLPNAVRVSTIATGYDHNLVIGSDSKLYAWGYNGDGELGNGTRTTSTTPVAVSLPAGVTATVLAAGGLHSMAKGSDGKLYAWGDNEYGQLGNGTTTTSTTPVAVSLPSGVTATVLAAGGLHSMVIGSDGKLYAWGDNYYGQLGNGTTVTATTPVAVSLPAGVTPTVLTAGGAHSMAIGSDGKLYAWGDNEYGQLGNGTTTTSHTPVAVSLPADVTPIAVVAGELHNLAIGSDGKLYAWGYNGHGELGNGTTTQSTTPLVVSLPNGITPIAIAAGYQHSLAEGSDGKLYAWGNNADGEQGNGTTTQSNTPMLVSLPGGVAASTIAAGEAHSIAILPAPSLSIGTVAHTEGNAGTTNFAFPVTLSYASALTVTVNYATANGTATAPADYAAASGMLTFSPGITTQTVTVLVVGDTLAEPNETFTVNLTSPTNATLANATGTGTILNDDFAQTNTSLSSSPNPAVVNQTVTFLASLTPITATGTVTFSEGNSVVGMAPLVNGSAVYSTTSLSVGSHIITATYSGDSYYTGSVSQPITQVVATCLPTVVNVITDDGTGTTCGTLSYAMSQPITGSTVITITFALPQGNTINFTGSLTATAKVKAGVTIYGGIFGTTNRIILNGNGVVGDGLHLAGHDKLVNLTIEGFGGRELVLEGTGNRMQGVIVIAS